MPIFVRAYADSLAGKSIRQRLWAGTALGLVLATGAQAQDQGAATVLPPLQVQGTGTDSYKADTPALSKLTEPLVDTPTSVTTVTQQVLQDRGQTTLADALRNVPGVTLAAGEFNWQGDTPYIRGFVARNDMFLDGMRDFGYYYRDPFDLERVEVLEGPDSILFGRGSTGGVINQATKQPFLGSLTAASLSAGTADTQRATLDVNTTIDGLGTPAALRVNMMANNNGAPGRDVVQNRRYGFAPSLALGIGTPTRVTLDYLHQTENNIPDYGIPWYYTEPAPVARSTYYGYQDDYLDNDVDIGTLKAEHDLGDDLMLREQARYANYTRKERISKAFMPSTLTPSTPLDSIMVDIHSYSGHSREIEFQSQTDLTAHFGTGVIQHALVAGFEYDKESSTPEYDNSTGMPPKSLLHPDENALFSPTATFPRVIADTSTETVGVYALDTMKLGEQWQLLLGARFDRFSTDFHENVYSVPPATTGAIVATDDQHPVDEAPSWRGALVYKPQENGTGHFSYGTSFNPSAEGLNLINSGENYNVANEKLAPEKNRNIELGTKWEVLNKRVLLSAAVFRTEKYNARVPDPDNPGFNILGGDQRVDGFELQAQGQLAEGWQITVGYDYLDSEQIKGAPVGAELPFVARNNLTFWTTYLVLPDLQLGIGGQYESARLAKNTAPIEKAPGYFTADAMVKYLITERLDAQLNVYNLTDKFYYDTLHPAFVIPGAGRSAMLTLNYRY